MTGRDRVVRALRFAHPDRAPRDLWHLPGVAMHRGAELDEVRAAFPLDFVTPQPVYGQSPRSRGIPDTPGTYVDEWGCAWNVAEEGVVGEVKGHPLEAWDRLSAYTPPWEVLDNADFGPVDAACATTDRFARGSTSVRLFERMQFLRGHENLFMDLACLPDEVYVLRDKVHAYYLREIELWAQTNVDGVAFMDDWGAQRAPLINPELWRNFFKPAYKEYCDVLKAAGKFVFFHSDGYIEPLIPDLIEIGVDALNSQLFCMDIEEVARRYRGKITFWGEICRQHVLPFGSTAEVREAVRRVRRALDTGAGGVIAQCEWGNRDPKENIEAVFAAWLEESDQAAGK